MMKHEKHVLLWYSNVSSNTDLIWSTRVNDTRSAPVVSCIKRLIRSVHMTWSGWKGFAPFCFFREQMTIVPRHVGPINVVPNYPSPSRRLHAVRARTVVTAFFQYGTTFCGLQQVLRSCRLHDFLRFKSSFLAKQMLSITYTMTCDNGNKNTTALLSSFSLHCRHTGVQEIITLLRLDRWWESRDWYAVCNQLTINQMQSVQSMTATFRPMIPRQFRDSFVFHQTTANRVLCFQNVDHRI